MPRRQYRLTAKNWYDEPLMNERANLEAAVESLVVISEGARKGLLEFLPAF